MLGLLIGLGLLELQEFIYPRFLTEFGMPVFFLNLSLKEFQSDIWSYFIFYLFYCSLASDLWQQVELASELESDLRDTVDWGKKWFVNLNAGKTQLASIGQSNNTDVIDVQIDESSLEEISYFKMLGLPFFSKLD